MIQIQNILTSNKIRTFSAIICLQMPRNKRKQILLMLEWWKEANYQWLTLIIKPSTHHWSNTKPLKPIFRVEEEVYWVNTRKWACKTTTTSKSKCFSKSTDTRLVRMNFWSPSFYKLKIFLYLNIFVYVFIVFKKLQIYLKTNYFLKQ